MKLFRCWILTYVSGWVCFEEYFEDEKAALAYCESETEFKGSSIVEEVE